MESNVAIRALEALAQEHRLTAFRSLVKAGPAGLTPSRMSEMLDLPAPTLSFHLAQLKHAGLVSVTRQGRSLIYVAAYEKMNELLGFLTENCCEDSVCAPSVCIAKKPAKEEGNAATTRTRRRV